MASKIYITLRNGYRTRNGNLAASALSLTHPNLREFAYSTNQNSATRDIQQELKDHGVFGKMTTPQELGTWTELIVCHWKVACALERPDGVNWVEAYEAQKNVVLAVIRGFQNSQWQNCFLPILYQTSNTLRRMAILADARIAAQKSGQGLRVAETQQEKLEDAARVINRGFTICISDRAPLEESRKWGTYYMTNLLFRVYFKLNTISLTKNILRAIHASAADMPGIEQFPKSQAVTFWYYLGVVNFLEGKYEEAEANLMFAYERCYAGAITQLELILTYLIPTRLITKQLLPTAALLSRYPRLNTLFYPFTQCIKSGNLKQFDEALAAGEEEFVKRRIYLTLERGREVVMRNLFRRAYMMQTAVGLARARVPLELFRVAVEVSQGLGKAEMEVEEVECLLANMVYSGFMKGYISREHSKMVLSSKDPFPGTTVEE